MLILILSSLSKNYSQNGLYEFFRASPILEKNDKTDCLENNSNFSATFPSLNLPIYIMYPVIGLYHVSKFYSDSKYRISIYPGCNILIFCAN